MTYEVKFKKRAAKELSKLPSAIVGKIVPVIDELENNPRPEGCQKLKVSDEDLWRIRIGDYRIIYQKGDTIRIVEIRKVGHRRDIYK